MIPVLTNEERAFAEEHRVARLATADAAGAPHVIPICYAVFDNHVYFVIDEKPKRRRHGLKRLRNIAVNPRVAFVIDDYDEDWTQLAYLLIEGTAHAVENRIEYDRVLSALRTRYAQYRSMALAFETHPMIRIIPAHAHLWRATRGAG
jgi:PPOX class probable F420-dependent enzyme